MEYLLILVLPFMVYHFIMIELKKSAYRKLSSLVSELLISTYYNPNKIVIELVKRLNMIAEDNRLLSVDFVVHVHNSLKNKEDKIEAKKQVELVQSLLKENEKKKLEEFEKYMQNVIVLNVFTSYRLLFSVAIFKIIAMTTTSFKSMKEQLESDTDIIISPNYKLSV